VSPDRKTDSPALFPVVLAGATAFLDLYATQPLLPLLARTFDASTLEVSFTLTASTTAVALAAPLAGRLADRVGRKRVIVGAALGLALATLLAATSTSLRQLIAWRFIQGLFTPGVFAVTIAYIHEQWPPARAGRATAAYVSGTVVGGFLGRLVAGVVAADVNWRASFLFLALLNFAAAAAIGAWLPVEPPGALAPRERSRLGALLGHLKRPQMLSAFGVGFGVLFSLVAMFTYVTFRLAAPPFGLSTMALGTMFAVYLVGAVATPFVGRVIDRHGHRFGLGLAVAVTVAGALVTLVPSLPPMLVGLAVCSTGVFIAQSATSSFVGAAADRDRGLAVGLYATFYYVGGSVGGSLPALFWDRWGWPGCVGLVVAVQLAVWFVSMQWGSGLHNAHNARYADLTPQDLRYHKRL
jgi:MFS transporter, YNFM family, putative membrane transport protein